jgi:hypothetical protein
MKQATDPAQAAERASIEELAARGGIAAEHVVLTSFGDDHVEAERSTALRQRIELRNPIRRVRIELRIFKDGFMTVAEHRGKRRLPEREIDLKFLDPCPRLSRYIAKKTARLALICTALASLWTGLALIGLWPAITGSLALVSFAAACAAAVRYLTRTRDTIELLTSHGRATVVTLIASPGCQQAYRAAVPAIVAAIRHANSRVNGDRATRLRAEIGEHYRLARAGVIDKRDCEHATRLILDGFEA